MAHEYFQQFAQAGHHVFTVNRIIQNANGTKSCGCENPKCTAIGKHPIADNWQKTPLWDEDQIAEMAIAIKSLGRGYGVLCNDLLVIDIDARNGGVASYQALLDRFPTIAGCGLIVETGSGNGSKHLYFKLDHETKVVQSHKDFPGIDFKHSGFVIGPGSPHASGTPYKVLSGSIDDIDEAPAELVEFLKKKPALRYEYDGREMSISDDTLRSMLDSIDCYDAYEDWVHVGMALHHATDGNGVDLWRDWSAKSAKYDESQIDHRWHGFGKSNNPITVGTLIKLAKDNGWIEPVTMDGSEPELQGWFARAVTGSPVVEGVTKEDIEKAHNPIKNCPVDVSTIDLTNPPGFTGEVARWIHTQCAYPRPDIAAAGALFALGNIAGLRHIEEGPHQTRTNLAFFCVAGSGTGKDSVLSAVKKLIHTAGLTKIVHGGFKSDREIYANLMRQQMACYMVDEIGGRLAKIANARKGGAAHLDGVMESFMEIYTKSNSLISLTGDAKADMDKELRDEYAKFQAKIDNNEDKSGFAERAIKSIEKRLAADGVIENPFLSLIGFTTPRGFAQVMTLENVETGFLGRTVLVHEPDNNPLPNPDFTKQPIPMGMELRLKQLAWGPNGDVLNDYRIEYYGEPKKIGHTDDAKRLLSDLQGWCWQLTQSHIDSQGGTFAALYRRLYEKIIKLATVMGAADGVIDVDHIAYATAMSLRDIHEKVQAVTIEDASFDRTDKLMMTIIRIVESNKQGMTMAQILNRSSFRKFRREDVENGVKTLAELGKLRKEDDIDKRSGKPLVRYFPT